MNSVLTPKNAIIVCTKRSGLLGERRTPARNHSSAHGSVHEELRTARSSGAIGMSEVR